MSFELTAALPVLLAFVTALALTPVVRGLARRRGLVVQPRPDRWHKKPTAMLGGVALFAAVVGVSLAVVALDRPSMAVVAGSTFLFLVGLIDDLCRLKPYQKLISQVMAATLLVYCNIVLPWTPAPLINVAITIFWLVGITNAVNLLDNMDGLAAGVCAIAAAFLSIHFFFNGQSEECLLLAVFAAAQCGFLVYNANPASIFMGDCGSMFIGSFLAGMALLHAPGGRSRGLLSILAVPVLTLFIPIFDTTLVTVLRKLAGRSVSQGGRDHTSHRLVALGLTERKAVWMLYGLSALAGFLALSVNDLPLDMSLAAIVSFTLLLTMVGVYLGGVKVYAEQELQAGRRRPLVAFLVDLSYKRRIFEVLLDVVLIILAYYLAYGLVFGSVETTGAWDHFRQTVPVLVFVKLAALLVMGVYRGLWRYISLDSVVVYAKGVVLGSVASVLVLLFVCRFVGYSRAVFVLDGFILLSLLTGSRLAFRLFRRLVPLSGAQAGRRVLIYGAGDAGDLLLRELRNNRALECSPVGFLDDDPLKKGKVINGLRVLGGNGAVTAICRDLQVAEVVISTAKIADDRLRVILHDCEKACVTVKRMRIHIEALTATPEC